MIVRAQTPHETSTAPTALAEGLSPDFPSASLAIGHLTSLGTLP